MESFFIASFPGNPYPPETLKQIQESVSSVDTPYALTIPELRVGTLDNLLNIADSVVKTDQSMQQLTYKIEKQLREFLPTQALLIDSKPASEFFTKFKWDEIKYKPETASLAEIVSALVSTSEKIDQQMKLRSAQFTQTNNQLQALERRSSGSLNVRNLADIIGENDFIQSEKLTTVFVVVSRGQIKDWAKSYFTLADRVVPHSSRLVAEDDQTVLYSVVLFKTSVDQFKANAREARFQVREFTQTTETPQSIEEEKVKLRQQAESQMKSYLEWCQSSYSEMMKIWMHLKLLRVFTESVLRFSLPVNFQAVAFLPSKKNNTKKILQALTEKFKTVLPSPVTSAPKTAETPEGTEPYYSFVYLPCPLTLNMAS